MHVEPEPASEGFYTALWSGALLIADDTAIDAFPVELNELAAEFFERFRPIAKA